MNRDNRLYTVDAHGKKHFTATGLLLQFFAIAEGLTPSATREEMDRSRKIIDEVMEGAERDSPILQMIEGSAEDRLMRVVEMLDAACMLIGESRALRIIYRPYVRTLH